MYISSDTHIFVTNNISYVPLEWTYFLCFVGGGSYEDECGKSIYEIHNTYIYIHTYLNVSVYSIL